MKAFFFLCLLVTGCSEIPGEKPITMPVEYASKFRGLTAKVWQDSNQHTHVKSETDLGMTIALGYVHGRDRAWQLDYYRRVVQGRTAEVHGYYKLRPDMMMRLINLYDQAAKIQHQLDAQTSEWLWAYAFGVNKAFSELDFSKIYEFKKLKYKPSPWTPTDTIALMLLQSFDQTRDTFLKEMRESAWLKKMGEKTPFIDDGLPWDTAILKKGEYQKFATTKNASIEKPRPAEWTHTNTQDFNSYFGSNDSTSLGSNNWVISPKRSETKNAFLENDPHLQLRHPSFWYWAHIQGPDLNAMGATFPGIPTITSGFNETAAWGLTNAYLDAGKISYISEDLLVKAQSLRPMVWLNFYGFKIPFFFKTFRRLDGHPILPLEAPPGKAMILDWTGFGIGPEQIAALHTVTYAKSVQDTLAAFQKLNIPSWNFVFADSKGNIGYLATGPALKNLETTPYGVTELKHGQNLNHELLEKKEMPQLINPERGYIVTANNRQWPVGSKWHGGYTYRTSFRAFRIEDLLLKKAKHGFESFKNIACDIYNTDASFIAPLLISNLERATLTDFEQSAVNELKKWNYRSDLECTACGIFRRTMDRLMETLDANDQFIYRWLKSGKPEEISKVLQPEFAQALKDITTPFGRFPKWREIHRVFFRHPSDDPRFLNSRYIETEGDSNTVNPGSLEWKTDHYEHTAGASQRLIVELSNPPRAIVQVAGHNLDDEVPNFDSIDSGFKRWSKCEFVEVQFPLDWEKVPARDIHF